MNTQKKLFETKIYQNSFKITYWSRCFYLYYFERIKMRLSYTYYRILLILFMFIRFLKIDWPFYFLFVYWRN